MTSLALQRVNVLLFTCMYITVYLYNSRTSASSISPRSLSMTPFHLFTMSNFRVMRERKDERLVCFLNCSGRRIFMRNCETLWICRARSQVSKSSGTVISHVHAVPYNMNGTIISFDSCSYASVRWALVFGDLQASSASQVAVRLLVLLLLSHRLPQRCAWEDPLRSREYVPH